MSKVNYVSYKDYGYAPCCCRYNHHLSFVVWCMRRDERKTIRYINWIAIFLTNNVDDDHNFLFISSYWLDYFLSRIAIGMDLNHYIPVGVWIGTKVWKNWRIDIASCSNLSSLINSACRFCFCHFEINFRISGNIASDIMGCKLERCIYWISMVLLDWNILDWSISSPIGYSDKDMLVGSMESLHFICT